MRKYYLLYSAVQLNFTVTLFNYPGEFKRENLLTIHQEAANERMIQRIVRMPREAPELSRTAFHLDWEPRHDLRQILSLITITFQAKQSQIGREGGGGGRNHFQPELGEADLILRRS